MLGILSSGQTNMVQMGQDGQGQLGSSPGPPGACIIPSSVKNVLTVSSLVQILLGTVWTVFLFKLFSSPTGRLSVILDRR
jgi:hypothetical protein